MAASVASFNMLSGSQKPFVLWYNWQDGNFSPSPFFFCIHHLRRICQWQNQGVLFVLSRDQVDFGRCFQNPSPFKHFTINFFIPSPILCVRILLGVLRQWPIWFNIICSNTPCIEPSGQCWFFTVKPITPSLLSSSLLMVCCKTWSIATTLSLLGILWTTYQPSQRYLSAYIIFAWLPSFLLTTVAHISYTHAS